MQRNPGEEWKWYDTNKHNQFVPYPTEKSAKAALAWHEAYQKRNQQRWLSTPGFQNTVYSQTEYKIVKRAYSEWLTEDSDAATIDKGLG